MLAAMVMAATVVVVATTAVATVHLMLVGTDPRLGTVTVQVGTVLRQEEVVLLGIILTAEEVTKLSSF